MAFFLAAAWELTVSLVTGASSVQTGQQGKLPSM